MLGEHFLKQFPIIVAMYISYTPKYTPVTWQPCVVWLDYYNFLTVITG